MLHWIAQVARQPSPMPRGEYLEDVSRAVREGGSFANPELFMAASALLIFAVGLAAMTRWHQQRKLRSKPLLTFHRLANALKLSLKDQWLLTRIARNQALPNPIPLLLSPATFDHHINAYVQPLSASRRARVRQQLAVVQRHIFGE